MIIAWIYVSFLPKKFQVLSVVVNQSECREIKIISYGFLPKYFECVHDETTKKNTHSKKKVYIKIKTTHDHEYNDLNVLIIIKIIIIA